MGLRIVGGYKRDNEQAGAKTANTVADLNASMQGSALPVVRTVPKDSAE